MTDVLRSYPWRRRLGPLFGASMVLLIVLRPAHWPLPQFGGSTSETLYSKINIIAWVAVIIPAMAALDYLAAWFVSRQPRRTHQGTRLLTADELQARMPSSFWTALAATLVCKSFVDFTFAGRPLPAGSEELFHVERWCDVFALAAFVPFYLYVRWLGPPSGWRIVRALVLEAPSQAPD
jgi:hypothetical protein